MEEPRAVVAALTLEEKASLLSGSTHWLSQPVTRDGEVLVEAVRMADGPHGLRFQGGSGDHLGIGGSDPATCFPPAVALGSSFDPDLVHRVARAIAAEARLAGVDVVLGPGINIKRSPLCGRNFEYLSEDPYLSGLLGTAYVQGLQQAGVGASLKHFAANNQEHDRLRVSADVDERPLREIYLRAFEDVVRDAAPWTVMCSYNRLNGQHTSEHPWLLSTVLREEWGFEGLVVSDWGAVLDRGRAVVAGLDLEMPGNGGSTDADVVAAVRAGSLDEALVDRCAERVVHLAQRAATARADRPAVAVTDDVRDALHASHHELAREVAGRCVVLLRNEPVDDVPLLPLAPGLRLAVIGELARSPRYQGAGSSIVQPTRLDDALAALRTVCGEDRVVFVGDDVGAAVEQAAAADVAVVFLGLPDTDESEGFDRTHLDLPLPQMAQLDAVLRAQPRTVVVLSHGGVVTLPFADRVPALLDASLLGQAGGTAVVDVLTGVVNPSGRLAETIPLRLADSPAFLDFPGERGHVRYGEGIFVGYRWYDARDLPVRFPFGHGLSYTSFDYSDLLVDMADDSDGLLSVRARVTNTGGRSGREVVQVYLGPLESHLARPPRELVGIATTADLEPGASAEVRIDVPRHRLARWFLGRGWTIESGPYLVEVGSSSRAVRVETTIDVPGDDLHEPLHLESTVAEVLADPVAGPFLAAGLEQAGERGTDGTAEMLDTFPIGRVVRMAGGAVRLSDIQALLDAANQAHDERSAVDGGAPPGPRQDDAQ